jgi:hypothetical protein
MTEEFRGTDEDDELYGDVRAPRRRHPRSVAPQANEHAVDADFSGEVEERGDEQP